MKVRTLHVGEDIQPGDRLKMVTVFGVTWHTFHRVTPKYAFVKWSDTAEGKFNRKYNDFGFYPCGDGKWPTNTYTPCRPVEQEAKPQETP